MNLPHNYTRLSDKEYWSGKYAPDSLLRPVNPRETGLRNYFRRYRHREFSKWLTKLGIGPGAKLIEVGAGGSVWLEYFAAEHRLDVTGLDYSETGCAAAEYVLNRSQLQGRVVCADLFDPPEELKSSFDILSSFGLVEHFSPTSGCLAACADFLKPGGAMLTVVPNLAGLNGAGIKFFDPKVYQIHVPLSAESLRQAHIDAGLEVLECCYLTPFWFSDWRVPADDPRRSRRLLRNGLYYPLAALAAGVWAVDDLIGNRLPGSRLLSPWVLCWARKRQGDAAPLSPALAKPSAPTEQPSPHTPCTSTGAHRAESA
jgi:2-polyprenyl-3-methyl-5-hydroxy-6-metoxy-1,4-benzoquinol methylase